ncbi:MAG TPA: DUF664 domain-containing protein [Mycobacterium sp.]|nr:DUF664 domain-containing protein [Mycobacterium sp.]
MTNPDTTIARVTVTNGEVAARDALLRLLAHHVDELCGAVLDADAAGVDPVAPVPSAWSLSGLVKHLAYVHRYWFQQVLTASATDEDFPWTEDDPDADWRVEPGETLQQLVSLLRSEHARAAEIVQERSLAQPGEGPDATPTTTAAGVLAHVLQEVARHAGQLDVVLELRGVVRDGT